MRLNLPLELLLLTPCEGTIRMELIRVLLVIYYLLS